MHFGGFMGGVVVNDEVKLTVAVIGKLGVYAFQKRQEFLVAVALMTSAENPSSGRVVSGKQRKGPVTHIIVDQLGKPGRSGKMGWLRSKA